MSAAANATNLGGTVGGPDDTAPLVPSLNARALASFSAFGGGTVTMPDHPTAAPGVVSAGGQPLFLDDKGRHFGTGTSISNYTFIEQHVVAHFTPRFPKDTTQREMLIFLERASVSPYTGMKTHYEVPSLSELNRYLMTPEMRRKYGSQKNCKQLFEDFGFAGVSNTKVPEWKVNETEFSIVCGRMARTCALTRACLPTLSRVVDCLMNSVWFVVVRRKLTPDDMPLPKALPGTVTRTADISFAALNSIPDPYYVTFHLVVNDTVAAPPPWLYIDDDFVGGIIRVGQIVDYEPPNNYNKGMTEACRNAICGKYNLLREDRGYLDIMEKLPTVNIYLQIAQ